MLKELGEVTENTRKHYELPKGAFLKYGGYTLLFAIVATPLIPSAAMAPGHCRW